MKQEITFSINNAILNHLNDLEEQIKQYTKQCKSKKSNLSNRTLSRITYTNKTKHRMLYIINLFINRQIVYSNGNDDNKQFPRYGQERLANLLIADETIVRHILNIMLEFNIIVILKKHVNSHKATTYMLTNEFLSLFKDKDQQDTTQFNITINTKEDNTKEDNTKEEMTEETIKQLIDDNELFDNFKDTLESISINKDDNYLNDYNEYLDERNIIIEECRERIEQIEAKLNRSKSERIKKKLRRDLVNLMSKEIYIKSLDKFIDDIDTNNDLSITKSVSCNRITLSPISHIKSFVRKYILIDGEETVQIDIKNSQPSFIANLLLNLKDYKDKEDIKLFADIALGNNKDYRDVYEYFKDKLNLETRKEAKDFWMKAAYGRIDYIVYEEFEDINNDIINKDALQLSNLFPSLGEYIRKFKDINDYNGFALKVQRLESKFVNTVSKLLFTNNIKNITVYDEFIVKKSQLQQTLNILNQFINDNGLYLTFTTSEQQIVNEPVIEEPIKPVKEYTEEKYERIYDRLYKDIKDNYTAMNIDDYTTLSDHFIDKLKDNKEYREDNDKFMEYYHRTLKDHVLMGKLVRNK